MSPVRAVAICLSKYATFEGRAARAEYWWFWLFNLIIGSVLAFIQGSLGQEIGISDLYWLAVLVPGLAVAVRRLHDTGRSGWYLLLVIVPLIGWIILLVWYCSKGEAGPNRFGPNPMGSGPGDNAFARP